MNDNERIRKIVGGNIRKHRQANNLTLDMLAKFLSITPGFLGLIERGKRGLSFKNLFKVSEVLNVPLEQFFVEDDAPAEKKELLDDTRSVKVKILKELDNMSEKELLFTLKMILSLTTLSSNKS